MTTALIKLLEASVAKHGVQPLTNAHLLNILKLAERIEARVAGNLQEALSGEVYDEELRNG